MSLDQLSKDLLKLANGIKDGKETKKFLKKEGVKLKNKTISVAKSRVKKKTGNYIKGIKSGKVYEYQGAYACRTYSTAPHAHLIEYGHIKKDRTGKEHGFQRGYHVFTTAKKDFEDEFESDAENFLDNLLINNGFK
ncbi:MAG: HK97 gp10 family phage protein [Cetobacterium sp.]|uniref:HK97 gp10 family phage protein n=1 Tax=Cetobacterium sp. TaxID=2071632 RepID=UPI003EE5A705